MKIDTNCCINFPRALQTNTASLRAIETVNICLKIIRYHVNVNFERINDTKQCKQVNYKLIKVVLYTIRFKAEVCLNRYIFIYKKIRLKVTNYLICATKKKRFPVIFVCQSCKIIFQ